MASVVAECYSGEEPATSLRHVSSHILSILFMLCGLGVLANVQERRRLVIAEEYHTLARAALCIHPIYENPTVFAAQSMVFPDAIFCEGLSNILSIDNHAPLSHLH
jgi:hypothetical protein